MALCEEVPRIFIGKIQRFEIVTKGPVQIEPRRRGRENRQCEAEDQPRDSQTSSVMLFRQGYDAQHRTEQAAKYPRQGNRPSQAENKRDTAQADDFARRALRRGRWFR